MPVPVVGNGTTMIRAFRSLWSRFTAWWYFYTP
jgi:hypothetical protein